MSSRERISIVVPVLNEAPRLAEHLAALHSGDGENELIVVDGGSDDGSAELAREICPRVLVERGGLARQLNRGAAVARGEILFFPHADTRLPDGWTRIIRDTLARPRTAGGAFRLGFDSSRLHYRVIAGVANLRNAFGIGPFGDQAIFVRHEPFDRIGGFRDEVLLEDYDLVVRLRREGGFRIARAAVRSSVRRWERRGVVATTLGNWSFLLAYLLGLGGPRSRAAYRQYRVESR